MDKILTNQPFEIADPQPVRRHAVRMGARGGRTRSSIFFSSVDNVILRKLMNRKNDLLNLLKKH